MYIKKSKDYKNQEFSFYTSSKENINLLFPIDILNLKEKKYLYSLKDNFLNQFIYGLSYCDRKYSVELYNYDFSDVSNKTNIDEIFNYINLDNKLKENIKYFKYFMFSFKPDLIINNLDIYIGADNYNLSNTGIIRKNTYKFYTLNELDLIKKEISNLIYKETKIVFEIIGKYFPYIYDDGTICIAQKTTTSALYFSRMNFEGFIKFLEDFSYDKEIINYLNANYTKFSSYKFDIGFDFTVNNNSIIYGKSSFYFLLGEI